MLFRTRSFPQKPPPYARVDLTHPLGRNCQCVCLFNDGDGVPKNAGPTGVNTYIDTPTVQYYQTQGGRFPMLFGSTVPTWTTNAAGRCVYFGGTFSGMDMGLIPGWETYDIDYPEFLIGATVARGETVCIIRRKVDSTLRASVLFGVEGTGLPNTERCGTHCPYSDGNIYWDYGGVGANNRLSIFNPGWSTNVERLIFHAGPRGSAVWRDGVKLGSQAVALTRSPTTQTSNFTGMTLNGGNGMAVNGSGDLQEINYAMFIANQWSDEQCRWWFAEPYAAFYTPMMGRNYFFVGPVPRPETSEVFSY